MGVANRSEDYEQQLNMWAKTYNAYERITDDWGQAHRILGPLIEEWEAHQRIAADWAGVDLLRAWAFYCARQADKDADRSLLEGYPEILAIAETIRNHPAATTQDMPPAKPGS